MSSPGSSRSADYHASPFTSPSSSQYPFPQTEASQGPGSGGRYDRRRGSASSSITSIGGVLDTATQGDVGIAGAGNNGWSYRPIVLDATLKLSYFSYRNLATATHSQDRSRSLLICSHFAEAPVVQGHSPCHLDQYSSHRIFSISAVSEASRLII